MYGVSRVQPRAARAASASFSVRSLGTVLSVLQQLHQQRFRLTAPRPAPYARTMKASRRRLLAARRDVATIQQGPSRRAQRRQERAAALIAPPATIHAPSTMPVVVLGVTSRDLVVTPKLNGRFLARLHGHSA